MAEVGAAEGWSWAREQRERAGAGAEVGGKEVCKDGARGDWRRGRARAKAGQGIFVGASSGNGGEKRRRRRAG